MPDFPAYPVDDVGVENFKTSIGFTPVTWPTNTTVKLCNVPWDEDYRDIIYWDSEANRNAYFDNMTSSVSITLEHLTYCKPGEPIEVNIPYSQAYTYNYISVSNPALPVPGEQTPPRFFYFIVGVSFISPNTTRLYLQLDLWTTYGVGVYFNRAFVERGHVALYQWGQASTLNLAERARRYLTAPEGLDVGSSYIDGNEQQFSITGGNTSGHDWWVIVISAADMVIPSGSTVAARFGTVDNPHLHVAKGSSADGMMSGCDVYAFTPANFINLMTALDNYPWIANQILSIFAYPSLYCSFGAQTVNVAGVTGLSVPSIEANQRRLNTAAFTVSSIFAINGFLHTAMTGVFSAHPKSKTWPFSFIKCDNLVSNPLTLKPELIQGTDLSFNLFESYLPPFTSAFVSPINYGALNSGSLESTEYTPSGGTFKSYAPYGDKLATALVWRDFPQFSITNDGYLNYLASNAHSLKFSRDNAGWQLDKSNASIQTSYDNANRGMAAAQANQQAAYETQRDISRFSMGNLVGNQLRDTYNALSQGTQGGFNAAFGADVATVINTTVNAATGATANELGNQQFQTSMQAQQGNIDANYKLQQWAARGDYQQAIAGIDASVQDAQLLPPTQAGTLGGGMTAILASRALLKFYVCAMVPLPNAQAKIASFWDRFGYAVCEYMTSGIANTQLLLNSRFTYWKLSDTVLSDGVRTFDEGVRNAIRGMFEKGVTVWASPALLTDGQSNAISNNAALTGKGAMY